MFNPKVSIIIPVYNGSNYMREAIDSALAQTYKNIEILVINDGSNDNNATRDIALSYGDRIRYYEKENGGVATALNLGIEKMCGDYFSWLSHDDVYYPSKIKSQIDVLTSIEDKLTVLYGNYGFINEKSELRWISSYEESHEITLLNDSIYALLNSLINGCTLLIYKEHFQKIGLFNIKLRFTQDYDLWYRMFPVSNIHFMKDVLVKTRTHDAQDSKKNIESQKEELTKLWMNMINQVSSDYIRNLSISEYELFNVVYCNLKDIPNYTEVVDYLLFRMSSIKKSNYKYNNKKYIFLYLTKKLKKLFK